MESRWYLKRGQTLENTTIEDRRHALHVGKTEWGKIQKHMDRNRLKFEAADQEMLYRKRMKEGSQDMTRNWENSVDNIRKRKEQQRLLRAEASLDNTLKDYLELRKEQDGLRKKYVKEKRLQAFQNTQYPRTVKYALLRAEVEAEREKQIEFHNMLRDHDRKEEQKFHETMMAKLNKDIAAEKNKVRQRLTKNMKDDKEFMHHMEGVVAAKKKAREEELAIEAQDNILAAREIEVQNRMLIEKAAKNSKEAREQLLNDIELNRKRKEFAKKEDAEINEVIDIYKETKQRIECIRKVREVELRLEKEQNFTGGVKAALEKQAAKIREEERNIEQTAEEQNRLLDKREDAAVKKVAQQREERLKDYEEFMKKKEKREADEDSVRRFELLNRVKQREVMEQYNIEKKQRDRDKKLAFRAQLDDQREVDKQYEEENKKVEEREAAEVQRIFDSQNTAFEEYSQTILDLAKKRRRNLIPITRAIQKYKVEAQGYIPKLDRTCKHDAEDLMVSEAGKRLHDPRTDPGYARCKCFKERLYK